MRGRNQLDAIDNQILKLFNKLIVILIKNIEYHDELIQAVKLG